MGIQNMCTICNNQINDLYFLIVGSKLSIHLNCLKCSICFNKLEMESKCFLTNGKFYCAEHWQTSSKEIYVNNKEGLGSNSKCKCCNLKINSNDYAIRCLNDNLYHLNCFACIDCKLLIEPGSKYGILNENIYCSRHYLNSLNKDESRKLQAPDLNNNNQNEHRPDSIRFDQNFSISSLSSSSCSSTSSATSSPLSVLSSTSSISRPTSASTLINNTNNFKTKQNSNQMYPLQNTNNKNLNNSNSSSNKKKRIRTSFKHQQLRIMKAHFQINQNPDSKDLKELSEKTGLQKRVLQVWFQNSRAKQRKSSGSCGGITSMLNPRSNETSNQLLQMIQADNSNNEDNDTYADYEECDEDEENLEDYEDAYDLDDSNSKSVNTDDGELGNYNSNLSNQQNFLQQAQSQQPIIEFYQCF